MHLFKYYCIWFALTSITGRNVEFLPTLKWLHQPHAATAKINSLMTIPSSLPQIPSCVSQRSSYPHFSSFPDLGASFNHQISSAETLPNEAMVKTHNQHHHCSQRNNEPLAQPGTKCCPVCLHFAWFLSSPVPLPLNSHKFGGETWERRECSIPSRNHRAGRQTPGE